MLYTRQCTGQNEINIILITKPSVALRTKKGLITHEKGRVILECDRSAMPYIVLFPGSLPHLGPQRRDVLVHRQRPYTGAVHVIPEVQALPFGRGGVVGVVQDGGVPLFPWR